MALYKSSLNLLKKYIKDLSSTICGAVKTNIAQKGRLFNTASHFLIYGWRGLLRSDRSQKSGKTPAVAEQ